MDLLKKAFDDAAKKNNSTGEKRNMTPLERAFGRYVDDTQPTYAQKMKDLGVKIITPKVTSWDNIGAAQSDLRSWRSIIGFFLYICRWKSSYR